MRSPMPLRISLGFDAMRGITMPRVGPGRATSISREKIERVRIIVHAQIRSITRVLRSLGPRSEGETAYSPSLVIKGATRKSKCCARVDPFTLFQNDGGLTTAERVDFALRHQFSQGRQVCSTETSQETSHCRRAPRFGASAAFSLPGVGSDGHARMASRPIFAIRSRDAPSRACAAKPRATELQ